MYGLPASPFAPRHHQPNHAYSRVGLETEVHGATPHRLIAMLFDGLFSNLAQAEGAVLCGERERKNHALMRAVRIVDEGLKAGLDMEAGGELALQLRDLYGYVTLRLAHANLRDDIEAIREVRRLMEPVHEAWCKIAPTSDHAAAA